MNKKKNQNLTLIACKRCVLNMTTHKGWKWTDAKGMTERSCRYSVQSRPVNKESFQREWEEKAIRPSGWEKSCCCDWNSWMVPTTESSSLLPRFNLRWQKSEINRDDLSHRLKRLLNSQRWGRLEDSLTGCLCGGCSWWSDVGECDRLRVVLKCCLSSPGSWSPSSSPHNCQTLTVARLCAK